MRETDVIDAVRSAVQSLTRDRQQGQADEWRYLDAASDPETAPPRSFRIALAKVPSKDDLSTYDDYIVEYTLSVYYPWNRGAPGNNSIDRMIAGDAERIDVRLQKLHEDQAEINLGSSTPFGIEELQHLIACRYSVVVHYRLTSSVL